MGVKCQVCFCLQGLLTLSVNASCFPHGRCQQHNANADASKKLKSAQLFPQETCHYADVDTCCDWAFGARSESISGALCFLLGNPHKSTLLFPAISLEYRFSYCAGFFVVEAERFYRIFFAAFSVLIKLTGPCSVLYLCCVPVTCVLLSPTAAVTGDKDCAGLLIREGADVNTTDKDGKTALMIGVVNGHLALVQLLLDNGADITLKTEVRLTPPLPPQGPIPWNHPLSTTLKTERTPSHTVPQTPETQPHVLCPCPLHSRRR